MFVYAHWLRDGYQQIHAFNKPDRAAQFAYEQIMQYAANEERQLKRGPEPKEFPAELKVLRDKLDTTPNPTLKEALALIELYEDYCRYVVGQESPLHTITDISVVE